MDRYRTARNVLIVLVLAGAVEFIPGGGRAALTAEAVLQAAFAAGFGYFGYRLYREHHMSIYGLGERYRRLLYVALGVAMVTIVATGRLWQSSVGTFVWFLLIGLVLYVLIATYRFSKTY
jgi:predicted membrane channel-forming protein YqfA (hemolysin III family)